MRWWLKIIDNHQCATDCRYRTIHFRFVPRSRNCISSNIAVFYSIPGQKKKGKKGKKELYTINQLTNHPLAPHAFIHSFTLSSKQPNNSVPPTKLVSIHPPANKQTTSSVLIPNTNPRPLAVHSRRNVHTRQFLEEQFRRVRQMYLRDFGLVSTWSALKQILLEVATRPRTD